jgi:hypothetical protein
VANHGHLQAAHAHPLHRWFAAPPATRHPPPAKMPATRARPRSSRSRLKRTCLASGTWWRWIRHRWCGFVHISIVVCRTHQERRQIEVPQHARVVFVPVTESLMMNTHTDCASVGAIAADGNDASEAHGCYAASIRATPVATRCAPKKAQTRHVLPMALQANETYSARGTLTTHCARHTWVSRESYVERHGQRRRALLTTGAAPGLAAALLQQQDKQERGRWAKTLMLSVLS